MNAFRFDPSEILVVTKFRGITFNEEMEQLSSSFFKDLDPHMERLYCFNEGESDDYLIGCDLNQEVARTKKCS